MLERFAACNDQEGFIEYDAVVVFSREHHDLSGIAPSTVLMEFLNETRTFPTGWTSEMVAAALVDNHLGTISNLDSRGQARGASSLPVSGLLEPSGEVAADIAQWDTFFHEHEEQSIASLLAVLCDLEAHLGHRILASEKQQVIHEAVLNCMLIGTRLATD